MPHPQPCRQLGTQTQRPSSKQKQTMVDAGAGPPQHTHTIREHPNNPRLLYINTPTTQTTNAAGRQEAWICTNTGTGAPQMPAVLQRREGASPGCNRAQKNSPRAGTIGHPRRTTSSRRIEAAFSKEPSQALWTALSPLLGTPKCPCS